MVKKTDSETELPIAPEPMPMPQAPRQKRIERQGSANEPYVHHYPQVRGGVCEHCGVIDPYQPSEMQYKLCPHYRGQQLQCSYCDATRNPDEVIRRHVLNITDHPTNPDALVVCCDDYRCVNAHHERFKISH